MDPIVSTDWLAAAPPDVVLVDVRGYLDGRDPETEFEAGHLPGAVLAALDEVCADPASDARGRHPLPSPGDFVQRLAALGIGRGDIVVAYDDAGGVLAARLIWMLRALGHDAALLDAGSGPFPETGPPGLTPVADSVTPLAAPAAWPAQLLAEIDEVAAAATGDDEPGAEAEPAAVIVDARPRERFEGLADSIDPRAGHIPGSRSLPCREHLGADGRLLDDDSLRARLQAAGIRSDQEFISSCGSGVTACHNLLVAEHLGFTGGRLFAGSWSQWSRDPGRPVATGP